MSTLNQAIGSPLKSGLRTFALITVSKSIINVLFSLSRTKKTSLVKAPQEPWCAELKPREPHKPQEPHKESFASNVLKDAVQLGAFVGTYSFVSKALHALLKELFGKQGKREHPFLSFFSGAVAGVSLKLAGASDRRSTFAFYIFVQALLKSAADLATRKILPTIPHIDVLLFLVASAILLHYYVAEPISLPPSYGSWIVKMGPIDKRALDVAKDLLDGVPYSESVLESFLTERNTVMPAAPLHKINCLLYHPQESSCVVNSLKIFVVKLLRSMIYYAPLTVFRLISAIRAPADLRNQKLLEWLLLLLRLSTFLASFVAIFQITSCAEAKLRPATPSAHLTYGWVGAIAGLSVLCVPQPSRLEISAWMLPRALQTLHRSFRLVNKIPKIPSGDIIAFSVSAGLLHMYWKTQPQLLAPSMRQILEFVFR